MRGAKETRACANCGELLTRYLSQVKGRNWYCNARCQSAHAPARITIAQETNPYRGQKETRPCANCGTPVTRYLSRYALKRTWTCSRRCLGVVMFANRVAEGTWKSGQKRRRGEWSPCATCGVPVYRNASQDAKGQGKYCSRACLATGMSKTPVVKNCKECGKEMRLKPSQGVRQFCSRACQTQARTMRKLDWVHNGKPARMDAHGYIMVYEPDHPNKSFHGWHYQHRLIVEQRISRYLRSDEHVHHVNGIKHDNRDENLEVMAANDHARISAHEYRASISASISELREYRRRYGPLEQET